MLNALDLVVLGSYLFLVMGVGFWFGLRGQNIDEFIIASRSLPGWAIGLSMFGSYISSISFLANPGKAYADNWNAFVFSLAAPIAAVVAIRWFVPFYRHSSEISAYEHLERRFGPWARTYAVLCFFLTQTARMGTVVYLLALASAPLTDWKISTTILATGTLMTVYTMAGGIKAVVWVGVLQSLVLMAGPAICLVVLVSNTPGGLIGIIDTAAAHDKFSLGSFDIWPSSLTRPTFWVIFVFGLVTHLGNFSVDQSYVQRYITARDNHEAAKSIWITTLLYALVAAVFFFIGTSLFVFYISRPELLGANVNADAVFPYFISTQLPMGLTGLVVAGIFAASMDSNLNSMATLTLCDVYKRYLRPSAGERESMRVLRLSTMVWGALGTAAALALTRIGGNVLDAWWQLAGIFSGGVLGLFLLGIVSQRVDNTSAAVAVILGVLIILWMTLPALVDLPTWLRNPLHTNLTIVVGTMTIFLTGLSLTKFRQSARSAILPGDSQAGH